jgi:hypothetical protein
MLFIIITGMKPFMTTNKKVNDPLWRLIAESKWSDYWELFTKELSPTFKALFESMITAAPNKRASINDVLTSKWF